MKYLINGVESELAEAPGVTVKRWGEKLLVNSGGKTYTAVALRRGDTTYISFKGKVYEITKVKPGGSGSGGANSGESRAPMPGQIVEITAAVGDSVVAGTKLMVLEAMKMQQPIVAGVGGVVTSIDVSLNDQVTDGQLLATVKPEDSE
ncbi:biotin/lipoyl-containing protein [Kamptonema cortianum]|nr:hypothetical protein [Geitlerinema splendidum]MDK3161066.1 biotin/lipoyl-containing protein [Kamptonema cortianum]